jgi:hypothetical protein
MCNSSCFKISFKRSATAVNSWLHVSPKKGMAADRTQTEQTLTHLYFSAVCVSPYHTLSLLHARSEWHCTFHLATGFTHSFWARVTLKPFNSILELFWGHGKMSYIWYNITTLMAFRCLYAVIFHSSPSIVCINKPTAPVAATDTTLQTPLNLLKPSGNFAYYTV